MKRKTSIDPIDIHVGNRLRLARNLRGISQERLAALEGITFQQIQKYERGINRLSSSRLVHFAAHLGFPVGWFYDGAGSMPGAAPRGSDVSGANGLPDIGETHKLLEIYNAIQDHKSRKAIIGILQSIVGLMAGV